MESGTRPELFVADDLILGVLAYSSQANVLFRHNRKAFHEFFYAHRENSLVRKARIIFRQRGLFPESPQLDQAYSNLKSCEIVYSYGNSFNPNELSAQARTDFLADIRKIFSSEELEEFRRIARDFQGQFGVST